MEGKHRKLKAPDDLASIHRALCRCKVLRHLELYFDPSPVDELEIVMLLSSVPPTCHVLELFLPSAAGPELIDWGHIGECLSVHNFSQLRTMRIVLGGTLDTWRNFGVQESAVQKKVLSEVSDVFPRHICVKLTFLLKILDKPSNVVSPRLAPASE